MRRNRKQDKPIGKLAQSGIQIEQLKSRKLSMKENALKCLWNALIIFLFVFGLTGFFVTSFELPCNIFKLMLFTAGISLFFAFFHMRLMFFNIGYVLFLFFIIFYSIKNYIKINSGYSAILNLIIVAVDKELNLASLREFTELYPNRYIAVTSCLILIIAVLACIFNMWVSRRNSIVNFFIVVIPVMEFCIYLNDEFSFLYLLVLLAAFSLFIFTKQNDELPINNKKLQQPYQVKRQTIVMKSREVEHKGNIIGVTVFTLLVLFVTLLVSFLIPDSYLHSNSDMKKKTDTVVYDVAMRGFSALFDNGVSGTGGMNNGTFGNVSSVSFDYETDLEVTLVPYSYKPVYIPTYFADTYNSRAGRWYADNINTYKEFYVNHELIACSSDLYYTYELLMNQNSQEAKAASAQMTIKNVAAGSQFSPRLYYDNDHSSPLDSLFQSDMRSDENDTDTLLFSPLLYDYHSLPEPSTAVSWNTDYDEYCKLTFTEVPEQYGISDTLEKICDEQRFGGTTAEVVDQIIDFMAENYRYSLSPGKTPDNKDFVLYFLEESKQGFCVHFASSACLLLRQMGIPARYVEGYCFDYTAYDDAVLLELGEEPSEETLKTWYDGYNELGFDRPVSIDLTDANAHAWVEVYFEGFGWIPVEFTVGAMAEDGNLSGLSSMLDRLMNGSDSQADADTSGTGQFESAAEAIGKLINTGLRNLVLIVLILVLVYILLKKIYISYRIYFASEHKRSVYQYRFITDTIRKDLMKRHKEERAEIEKMLITHSVLKDLLSREYGMNDSAAENAVNRYEAYHYSEFRCGVDIDLLTLTFQKLITQITGNFGFIRRTIYRLYLFMPAAGRLKKRRAEEKQSV